MRFSLVDIKKPPKLQRIRSANDVKRVTFVDGIAEVEVPIELVELLPLKHDERNESPRLQSVERSIRAKGYSSLDPIVCRVGALGRWVVVDGGHRLTAAQHVSKEFWTRLWGRDLGAITFILFETEHSYSKLDDGRKPTIPPASRSYAACPDPDVIEESILQPPPQRGPDKSD